MYIQPAYKTSNKINGKYLISKYGFRKNENNVVLKFPVYKYKNKPLIFAELIYDEEENKIYVRAVDNDDNFQNYNIEPYGKSEVIIQVNKEIWKKLNALIEGGVIC